MDMVVHKAMAYQLKPPFETNIPKQPEIDNPVRIGIENILSMVPPLRNMMDPAGNYNTWSA
jgi:hypothetical protein